MTDFSMTPQIMVTGDISCPEFVRNWHAGLNCRFVECLSDAISIAESEHQDLVVLAQSRRSQFPTVTVTTLFEATPLSDHFALLGPWCEGETRSGFPFPGWTRIYWNQFPAMIARFVSQSTDRRHHEVSKTESIADRLLAENEYPIQYEIKPARFDFVVGIATRLNSEYAFIQSLMSSLNCQSNRIGRHPNSDESRCHDLIIANGDCADSPFLSNIESIKSRFPNAPLLAILGFHANRISMHWHPSASPR